MRLDPDWRRILKRAWSVRYMIIAAILSGIEVALPFFSDEFPKRIFAALSFVFVVAAFVARFVAQGNLNGNN